MTLTFVLALLPAVIAAALSACLSPAVIVVAGLIVLGIIFALNSAVHSYLILAYTDHDKAAMNVGIYYLLHGQRLRPARRHPPLLLALSTRSPLWNPRRPRVVPCRVVHLPRRRWCGFTRPASQPKNRIE